jgi:L-asparaginase
MKHLQRGSVIFLTSMMIFFAGSALGQQQLPLIKVIATGGTIANTAEGRISGEAYVAAIPEIKKYARIEVIDFMRVASSAIAPEHWMQIGKKTNDIFSKEKEVQAVVVTTGSNTLAETAYFLNLVVKSDKPVVLTGAQRRFKALSSDSPKNFLQALRVASSPEARGKGVLVVTNDCISGAREVRKNITRRLETWDSGDIGFLGYVDEDKITFYRAPLRKHTLATEFDITNLDRLPRVDVIHSYAGAPGDIMELAVEQCKAEGIVIAGFPTGTGSRPWQNDVAAKLYKKGIPVVLTNRAGIGRIAPEAEQPFEEYFLVGDNLVPDKARILLMLALSKTKDLKEIQRMFVEY